MPKGHVEIIQQAIDIAVNAEWKLLIALLGLAGLRNPLETLQLRWSDINWAEGRMKVTSAKMRKQGVRRRSPSSTT